MSTVSSSKSDCFSLSKNSTHYNTKNTLISLMKETKINPKLQTELLQLAEEGKSFPFIPKDFNKPKTTHKAVIKPKLLKLPSKPMQRTKIQIEQLGCYEIEKYRPNPSKTRPPEEKERLQNVMAFGYNISNEECAKTKAVKLSDSEPVDLFNEILLEIKERQDFLHDMHQLGLAKKYLPDIQIEISQRLNELEKLDESRAQKILSDFKL